jgi:hypothetical protein
VSEVLESIIDGSTTSESRGRRPLSTLLAEDQRGCRVQNKGEAEGLRYINSIIT